ncbi:hypothetical protein CRE_30287 [Caenorhabditis remanei]|uniref:DUF7154 domain-containing protein n=1 Tax=Caenorhabditis remanei TaxID=31234 RepID=E3NPI3_CAERE|nr:hypothetical protein CRE_30287 [Caenorhabditis remanei]
MTWGLHFPYQFLAQNFVVSGSGRIEIPAFKTPIPPHVQGPCLYAVTVQNHPPDRSIVSINFTIESTDEYNVQIFSDSVYGKAQLDVLKLSGSLSYKWTIDYHYNTDEPQIIECRMYCERYHDFLPLPDY